MRDLESLLADLCSEGMASNQRGKVGLASLLFDAYNRIIVLAGPPVEKTNHGGGTFEQVQQDHHRHGGGNDE